MGTEIIVPERSDPGIYRRGIANTMTLLSWRNGPVEKVHAGQRFGHGFNERRVLPRDETAIIRQAQNVLCVGLQAAES